MEGWRDLARGIEEDRGDRRRAAGLGKGPASCNPLLVPRAREPIVTGENSGGGGGAFSFSEGGAVAAAEREEGSRGNEW